MYNIVLLSFEFCIAWYRLSIEFGCIYSRQEPDKQLFLKLACNKALDIDWNMYIHLL
jgi:hypothetical protein